MYDWAFLIVTVLPVIGLLVVAFRNLDAITDAVFHHAKAVTAGAAKSAPATLQCANCGENLAADAKFCAGCGTAVPAAAPPTQPAIFCSACGQKNEGGALACEACGKPLAHAATS